MTPLTAGALLLCVSVGIVDGDTLRCGSDRIRIWGVNAPEASTPLGPAATRAMATIAGSRIVCVIPPSGQAKDRYGRLVRRCSNEAGQDIAAELTRQGYATDWPVFSKGEYADEESEARSAKRGMWR